MCGIAGIWNDPESAKKVRLALHAQQHRASEFAGMVTRRGPHFFRHAGPGIAREVFNQSVLRKLRGTSALGHIRYSTTLRDDEILDNTQPILGVFRGHEIALAHNGNLTNTEQMQKKLPPDYTMSTSMDSEYIVRLITMSKKQKVVNALIDALQHVEGSYALGILCHNKLIAVRDPSGNRLLSYGRLKKGYAIASETCALEKIGAKDIQDVPPGHIVCLSDEGINVKPLPNSQNAKTAQCIFELLYLSLPGSVAYGEDVSDFRIAIGEKLEELFPVPNADIVVPIPDSGNLYAIGYGDSGRNGKPRPAISRNHYVGRSFNTPEQDGERSGRASLVREKFQVSASQVRGKIVVITDDSIVRLNTLPEIMEIVRSAGAKEIHVRIGAPLIAHPCIYGIDTPTYEELGANRYTIEKMRKLCHADSLEFLPLDALRTILENQENFCYACMDGKYPLPK